MSRGSENSVIDDSVLKDQENRVYKEWKRSGENRTPGGPRLMLFNPAVVEPEFSTFSEYGGELVLRMESTGESSRLCWGEIPVVRAHSHELPLQTESHGLVLLSHVVSNGTEPELDEACRVLQPGGVLLIMGLNHIGFRFFRERSGRDVPGLRPLMVRERLERLDMNVRILLAAGFMNRQWPDNINSGAARILVPVADLLMIVARKNEPRLASPFKRTQLRTVSAPSALAGS